MHRHASGVLWVLLYVVIVLSPLVLMLIRPVPPGRPFIIEASIALGFVGLVMMAVQFALIARYPRMSAPFGIDVLLRYHRNIAGVALLFVILHPVLLIIQNPALAAWLDPIGGTWASRTGAWAIYAFILLTLISIFRRQLRFSYEAWRFSHTFLGIAAVLFGHIHIHLAGRYTDVFWREAIIIAISLVMVGSFGYIRLIRPAIVKRRPYEVAEVRPERGDVWSFSLKPKGHDGLSFMPGQYCYIKLNTPYSFNEHPFSIASSSERRDRLEFAIKELGDFTNRIGKVSPGTITYVDGPHGSFSPDLTPAPGYVFIAGGIGIGPFMSLLRSLADRGDPRPVLLFYGEKNWEITAFREELETLRKRMNLEIVYVLENPPEGWEGETGFVTEEVLRRNLPDEGFERHVFICGPNPMIDAVERSLARVGFEHRQVSAERFNLV